MRGSPSLALWKLRIIFQTALQNMRGREIARQNKLQYNIDMFMMLRLGQNFLPNK